MSTEISCSVCERTFSSNKNLYRHLRNFHPNEEIDVMRNKGANCSICKYFCSSRNLLRHIQTYHPNIKLCFDTLFFYSLAQFNEWKTNIEYRSQSLFIKRRKDHLLSDGRIAVYYYCDRSEEYNPLISRRSFRGSNKIGFLCPAHFIAYKKIRHDWVKIKVVFQSTHLGHDCEFDRMSLSATKKQKLNGTLQVFVPKSNVIENTQKNLSRTKSRTYTTGKDFHNICRDFKIDDECIFNREDAISVDIKVNKMLNKDKSSILLYKPIGETLPEYTDIVEEEFLLGIMNSSQLKMLELYGNDIILIDSIHSTNHHGFHLITVMVQDSNLEGFPVAILYSTRITVETFVPFFAAIKKQMTNLKPTIFMSDEDDVFYNAFRIVFGEVEQHLLSAWHVRQAWNVSLNSKIKDKGIREKVSIELQQILQETDIIAFEKASKSFLEDLLNSEETKTFGIHFKTNYMNCGKQWAYCYRQNSQVNTNINIERWHREIKFEELSGKIIKLDKSLDSVLSIVSRKFVKHVIVLKCEKLVSSKIEIRKRHDRSREISENMVIEVEPRFSWIVYSGKTKFLDSYVVCYKAECSCDICCDKCNVCIHQFSCMCLDYVTNYIMCKHIHFICKNYAFGKHANDISSVDSTSLIANI